MMGRIEFVQRLDTKLVLQEIQSIPFHAIAKRSSSIEHQYYVKFQDFKLYFDIPNFHRVPNIEQIKHILKSRLMEKYAFDNKSFEKIHRKIGVFYENMAPVIRNALIQAMKQTVLDKLRKEITELASFCTLEEIHESVNSGFIQKTLEE